ncbi:ABC transporter component [Actinomyces sp. Chiba101]|uniref:ABC-2 type transport system ATP-binding protein n=1 Tax=Actinomyces denticolens TaxID=52767 RepID=A0ABY1IKN7_9ACTO|nr:MULTISPECIES: ATP-binding cassette domain-containing protein [Actinomyces]BAW92762.1 ABC transporter component [Actinomyces sp. Chiba101]GAV94270.1 mutacin ABC transporter, ATP-binding protein MutF [Actinomyces denticolens]SHJ31147.1 ABC-2 type transport system ATP-binding protein [Actinomyces denticolens]SUU07207.1 Fluoroquinolones export ATP-binding protein Rv2688c/MT2762 [Actinomyces denticolens]
MTDTIETREPTAPPLVPPASSARPEAPTGLRLHGVTKSFSSHQVLTGVDLTARPGRVYALLGPNGAGKSTALAIALGLETADSGEVLIMDRPWSRSVLRHVGASLNGPALFPQLSAHRNLLVHCRLTGTSPSVIAPLLARVGLEGAGRKRAGSFSTGMKVRLALAMALLTDPSVLILDEPQNGLDPQGIIELRDLMRSLAAQGRTVVVSSHQLGEMARMADDVGVLVAGRLAFEGPLSALAHPDDTAALEAAYLSLVTGGAVSLR